MLRHRHHNDSARIDHGGNDIDVIHYDTAGNLVDFYVVDSGRVVEHHQPFLCFIQQYLRSIVDGLDVGARAVIDRHDIDVVAIDLSPRHDPARAEHIARAILDKLRADRHVDRYWRQLANLHRRRT